MYQIYFFSFSTSFFSTMVGRENWLTNLFHPCQNCKIAKLTAPVVVSCLQVLCGAARTLLCRVLSRWVFRVRYRAFWWCCPPNVCSCRNQPSKRKKKNSSMQVIIKSIWEIFQNIWHIHTAMRNPNKIRIIMIYFEKKYFESTLFNQF